MFAEDGNSFSLSMSSNRINSDSKKVLSVIHENINLISKDNIFEVENPSPIIDGKRKSDYALDIFNSQGNIAHNPKIGTVELVKSGAKSTMMHGFGNTKLAAVEAIKPVIEKGSIISFQKDYDAIGVDRYIVAAKGKIGNDNVYVGVIIKSYPNQKGNSKLYLHEAEIIEAGSPLLTAPQLSVDTVGKPADITVPQSVSNSQDYSIQNSENDSDIRYSLRPKAQSAHELLGKTADLERRNQVLKEDVRRLNELVKV